ncbi:MAG: hypothetical protein E5X49_29280 [Mesorhizobium sp.]|nr:MAG: hypothetical protein E5X49_29280 [Mesorhizobium sp.]
MSGRTLWEEGSGKSSTSQNPLSALVDPRQKILIVGCDPRSRPHYLIRNSKAQDTVGHLGAKQGLVEDLKFRRSASTAV